jgi:hypothetical protein
LSATSQATNTSQLPMHGYELACLSLCVRFVC